MVRKLVLQRGKLRDLLKVTQQIKNWDSNLSHYIYIRTTSSCDRERGVGKGGQVTWDQSWPGTSGCASLDEWPNFSKPVFSSIKGDVNTYTTVVNTEGDDFYKEALKTSKHVTNVRLLKSPLSSV